MGQLSNSMQQLPQTVQALVVEVWRCSFEPAAAALQFAAVAACAHIHVMWLLAVHA
jgi:hypothetical protein